MVALPVQPLSPPGPIRDLTLRHDVSHELSLREGDIIAAEYRRAHFLVAGEEVPVRAICYECSHTIFGLVTIPRDTSFFDMICPSCNEIFCRVGKSPANQTSGLVFECICEQPLM